MTTQAPAIGAIAPATMMGFLSLTVADLERSLAFYTQAMGMTVLEQTSQTATLGALQTPLLHLVQCVGARAFPVDGVTGLYHVAYLMPTRGDLGRWLQNWLTLGLPMPGQGDHVVSEALYIRDPDGHGIEVYRDRPNFDPFQVANGGPVDIQGVLAEGQADGSIWTGMPATARIGHMHLQVGDIGQAHAFYNDVLGFGVIARMPTALFIAAGRYHHHMGLNVWHSKGRGPAPADVASLRFFAIELPSADDRAAVLARLDAAGIAYRVDGAAVLVSDPWQNTIALLVGAATNAADVSAIAQLV